jgi:hypothetical protein
LAASLVEQLNESLRTLLVMFMSLDDSLLRELRTLCIITLEEADAIQSRQTRDSAVDQFLTIAAGLPNAKQEEFLVASEQQSTDSCQCVHVRQREFVSYKSRSLGLYIYALSSGLFKKNGIN